MHVRMYLVSSILHLVNYLYYNQYDILFIVISITIPWISTVVVRVVTNVHVLEGNAPFFGDDQINR